MEKLSKEAEEILLERFGKDSVIALATTMDNKPYVRSVNSFYNDGAFYVLTSYAKFILVPYLFLVSVYCL